MMDIYSVKEASQKIGLDTSQVRKLLAKGDIEGKKLGHDWVVLNLGYKRKRKPKGNLKSNNLAVDQISDIQEKYHKT